jgi:hypothetical protein
MQSHQILAMLERPEQRHHALTLDLILCEIQVEQVEQSQLLDGFCQFLEAYMLRDGYP